MDCSLLHCDTLGNASTGSSSGGRRRQLGEEGKKNERKVSERRMEERVLYSTVTLIRGGSRVLRGGMLGVPLVTHRVREM